MAKTVLTPYWHHCHKISKKSCLLFLLLVLSSHLTACDKTTSEQASQATGLPEQQRSQQHPTAAVKNMSDPHFPSLSTQPSDP